MNLISIISVILIVIVLLVIIYVYCKKSKATKGGDEKMNNFKNSITKLSNLFNTNSSEEAQYLSKVLDAKVWTNYSGTITKTTTTITTNIAGITANPFGLLTNVILSAY